MGYVTNDVCAPNSLIVPLKIGTEHPKEAPIGSMIISGGKLYVVQATAGVFVAQT
jgi:hypothetical protein